ncbi:MAG: methyltransferase domain-containing protein [Syntrophobacteraceae bacterium]|nr:methyltransferase domain-containing protein [Syntrophobacteraceae bacterium]
MTGSPLTSEQIEEMDRVQRRYFNENVDLFEPPLPEGVPERLAATANAGRIKRGQKVIDVGTGTGILIFYLLKHGPSQIHACDLAENMLCRVKEKYPRVLTHLCSVKELPLPDNSLDAAFINACFSNILDKAASLKNLHRILRPQGTLVISHPLGKEFIVELKKHTPFYLDLLPEKAEAKELLDSQGFEMVTFRDDPLFYLVVAENRKDRL